MADSQSEVRLGAMMRIESTQKLEMIEQAIKKLLGEERPSSAAADGDDHDHDRRLLSRLLSELESLKRDGTLEVEEEPRPASDELDKLTCTQDGGGVSTMTGEEEKMVKELREVKRQNLVTHCLLSVMIVLTVAWQLSEVSLVLKLKDGLSHPFRSFGGKLAGMLRNLISNGQDAEKHKSSSNQHQMEDPPSVPPLQMPELHHLDLGLNGENHG